MATKSSKKKAKSFKIVVRMKRSKETPGTVVWAKINDDDRIKTIYIDKDGGDGKDLPKRLKITVEEDTGSDDGEDEEDEEDDEGEDED